jgi:hypothetical protein
MRKINTILLGILMLFPSFSSFGSLPGKVFAPYVDVMLYPTFSLVNCNKSTGQKYFTLAFITAGSNGQPAWGGVTPLADNFMLDQITQLRAAGGDVIVSFGGANGTPIDGAITSVTSLVAAYSAVIDKYKLTWIDFDIEGWWVQDQASIDRRNQAAKQLQSKYSGLKITYCLPVMPTGLTADGVNVINKAKAAGVKIYSVNVMAMDYGGANNAMGSAAISAAQSTRSQTGLNIGITPMIGQNDSQGEIFSLSNASQVLSFAKSNSYVNMLAMWSATRDNGGCPGSAWASATCSGISQSNFAFINTFKSFSGSSGGGGTPTNNPPSVDITSPTNGAKYTTGSSITISASASDVDGTVTSVQFYRGSTSIGTDNSSPYSVTWSNAAAGTYTLTAVATDNSGAKTTSSAITITVGSTSGGGGGSCSGLPVYPAGLGSYVAGDKVSSGGNIYQVKPYPYSGWANTGGAYAPGTGWAWQDAWILVGPCTKSVALMGETAVAFDMIVYANPMNADTKVKYSIPVDGNVLITLTDIGGQVIATLVNEYKDAGEYEIVLASAIKGELANGAYFISIKAGNLSKTVNVIKN